MSTDPPTRLAPTWEGATTVAEPVDDHPEWWLYFVQFGGLGLGLLVWALASIGFSSAQCSDLPPPPPGLVGVAESHVRCQPAMFAVVGFAGGYIASVAGAFALETVDKRTRAGSRGRQIARAVVNVAATAIPLMALLATWKIVLP
jgi:fructose-specific phosphotransferase system IIC component